MKDGQTASRRRASGESIAGAALPDAGRHVVLVAPTRGDHGNLAVLDTLLQLTDGPVEVVLSAAPDPALTAARSTMRVLPALLAGTKHDRRGADDAVERAVDGANHCTVIAPDSMSSREDVEAFMRCLSAARRAAAAGIDTRVIGFAWSLGAGAAGAHAVRLTARTAVQLFVRDDLTQIRGMNDGLTGLRSAADLAFAGTDRDDAVLDEVDGEDHPFAVLTVCSNLTPGSDPAADYAALVEHLQRRGLRVVLLPAARTGYDLLLLGRVSRAVGGGGASVIRRPLGSAELRSLTGAASLTITDRTRIAVVALSAGRPVVGLATHSELERMLRTADLAACAVLPQPGFAAGVNRVVDRILDDQPMAVHAVRRMLPDLVDLALANLAGLPAFDGEVAARQAARTLGRGRAAGRRGVEPAGVDTRVQTTEG